MFSMSECAMTATLLPRFAGLKHVVVNVDFRSPPRQDFEEWPTGLPKKNGGIL